MGACNGKVSKRLIKAYISTEFVSYRHFSLSINEKLRGVVKHDRYHKMTLADVNRKCLKHQIIFQNYPQDNISKEV